MQSDFSKKIKIIIIISLVIVSGCSKKDSVKTKTDYLVSSTWKFSSAGIDQDGNGTIDIAAPASLVEPCLTDNKITFKADKTGSIDEGPTKCDATTAQVTPFTWTLSNDDTQINLTTSIVVGIGNDAKIIELTDSKFVLSKTLTVPGIPIPVPVVVILVH